MSGSVDHVRGGVLVVELAEQVVDAVEPGCQLVVGRNDVPGRLLDVGVLQGRVLGHRVPDVELVLGEVHLGQLPALQRLGVARLEPLALLLEAHREPVLQHHDSRPDQHPLELGAAAQELLVLGLGAESHHPLDVRAVVPAPVEQDHLPGSGQLGDVPLEVPLGLLALRRLGQSHHAHRSGARPLGDRLDDTTLPRGAPPLEDDQDLEALPLDPVLQHDQLLLQLFHLPLVHRGPELPLRRVLRAVASPPGQLFVVGALGRPRQVSHEHLASLPQRRRRRPPWSRQVEQSAASGLARPGDRMRPVGHRCGRSRRR